MEPHPPRGPRRGEPVAFYDRLVDALLARGIQPAVTLYHWDLPAALDDDGGWLNRDVADWFADYARVVFRALGDRVPLWATINEPWVIMDGGYVHGTLAPGHRDVAAGPRVAHNLLRAHGAAVQAYRAEGKRHIGIVLNLEPKHPASDTPQDGDAARRADAYMNRLFLEPVLGRPYPAELPELFGDKLTGIKRISRRAMSAPSSGSSKVHAVEQQEILDEAFH